MSYLKLNSTNRAWNPLSDFRREMDRLFDDFWATPSTAQSPQDTSPRWSPVCDIEEADNHYMISLELAGVPKDQVRVEFHDNQIVISGERLLETKRKEAGLRYSERSFGKFQRAFTLPAGLDPERIEANHQDGILRVYIPKNESTKPRQIKITNGSGASFFERLIGQSSTKEKEERHSSSNFDKEKVAS